MRNVLAAVGGHVISLNGFRYMFRNAASMRRRILLSTLLTRMTTGLAPPIDAHLHLWSPKKEFLVPPPAGLEEAGPEKFLETGITKAVIAQPINYKFDHSYLTEVLASNDNFRGVLLADPNDDDLETTLRRLHNKKFTGIRVNPALWDGPINDAKGEMIFRIAADLKMVVCVMAFGTGFSEALEAQLSSLMTQYPTVIVALDHFGFPRSEPGKPPSSDLTFDLTKWQRLLDFSTKPTAYVKLSALFRVATTSDFSDLDPRFQDLLTTFGPQRLFWGSDFPFVLTAPGGYHRTLAKIHDWITPLSSDDADAIIAGNADRLFFSSS